MSILVDSSSLKVDSFYSKTVQSNHIEHLLNQESVLVASCDLDLRYRFVNQAYASKFGYDEAELIGKPLQDVLEKQRYDTCLPYMYKALAGEEVLFQSQVSYDSDQSGLYEARYLPTIERDGKISGFYAVVRNIEDTLEAVNSHELLRYAVNNSREGLSIQNRTGIYIYVNPAKANMFGYDVDEVLGQSYHFLFSEADVVLFENEYFAQLCETGKWFGTLHGRKKNGGALAAEVSLAILRDSNGNYDGFICSCRDVTEKKQADDQLSFLAHYDNLTGLINRRLFKDRLGQMVSHAQRRQEMVAVFFLDLDDFKHINDTFGHATGDLLIQKVGERLKLLVRGEDLIARFGGDEFTIAICGISDQSDVVNLARKIIKTFDEPVMLEKQQLVQKTSIGISMYPTNGGDIEDLIKCADTAMYKAKSDGLHGYRFYSNEMSRQAASYLKISSELQQATDTNGFELHFQPFISTSNYVVHAFESLVRWQHPNQGLVYPSDFIPQAEKSGLITSIGRQVLNQSCRQASEWLKRGYQFEYICVNVSGVELQDGFVEMVKATLEQNQLFPNHLKLEITETFLMSRYSYSIDIMQQLRALGVRIAIDGFGVGYSSLTRLKHLPVTCIKIDKSFVRDIHQDLTDQAIVKAVIDLCNSLKLSVIAEGVENAEQLETLQQLDAHFAQGYYISRPTTANNIDQVYRQIDTLKGRLIPAPC